MNRAKHHSSVKNMSILVMMASTLLIACSAHVSIRKTFNVSKANETVITHFKVTSTGDYSFALLFARAPTPEEDAKQTEILGSAYRDGVPITVNLRINRGNEKILDQDITSKGVSWAQVFQHEERMVSVVARLIRALKLPPGNYTAEFRTLADSKEFIGIESYVEVSYHSPKR